MKMNRLAVERYYLLRSMFRFEFTTGLTVWYCLVLSFHYYEASKQLQMAQYIYIKIVMLQICNNWTASGIICLK